MKHVFALYLTLLFLTASVSAADFVVTNTNNSGAGSLREAIMQANSASGAPHNINFNIPFSDNGYNSQKGIWTINLTSPLTYILKSDIVIDGTTQTAFLGNTNPHGPEIMLFGGNSTDFAFHIFNASRVHIKGFIISGFIYGIQISGNNATQNIISGNYIGVNHDATDTLPNYVGIEIMAGAHNNIVGGSQTEERNIVSGNAHIGIRLLQASHNIVKNNYVGTDRTGTYALPNYDGISLEGNTQHNTIGGLSANDRNIVSGNVAYGIPLIGIDTRHNIIIGNYIGTNVSGNSAIPNTYGVLFDDGSRYNILGGYAGGAANLISGNSGYGVFIYNLGTIQNDVIGNLIGTDKSGMAAVPNATGIVADGAAKKHFIDANVISGNLQQGIAIHVVGTDNHIITRNKIGTDISGLLPLPNNSDGIRIAEGGKWNIIGAAPDSGNIIAFNGGNGITIMTDNDLYNTISGNSIFANAGLGIDLYYPGPNINDPGDTDTGPNMRLNYPVIENAVYDFSTGITTVSGSLDTQNPHNCTIELFLSDYYPIGYGQGKIYLTSVSPHTDGTFSVSFNQALSLTHICATNTDWLGNTSEFSLNYELPPPASIDMKNTNDFFCEIYPNPTQNYVVIDGLKSGSTLLQIYDIYGHLLVQQHLSQGNNIISLKDVNKGVLFFRFSKGNTELLEKIIKL